MYFVDRGFASLLGFAGVGLITAGLMIGYPDIGRTDDGTTELNKDKVKGCAPCINKCLDDGNGNPTGQCNPPSLNPASCSAFCICKKDTTATPPAFVCST